MTKASELGPEHYGLVVSVFGNTGLLRHVSSRVEEVSGDNSIKEGEGSRYVVLYDLLVGNTLVSVIGNTPVEFIPDA